MIGADFSGVVVDFLHELVTNLVDCLIFGEGRSFFDFFLGSLDLRGDFGLAALLAGMSLSDGNASALIQESDNQDALYVVMPMRL